MYLDTVTNTVDAASRLSENSKHLFMPLPNTASEFHNYDEESLLGAKGNSHNSAQENSSKVKTQLKKALFSLRCIISPAVLRRLVTPLPIIIYIVVFTNYFYIRQLLGLDIVMYRAANKYILANAELALFGFLPHLKLGKHHHIVFDFLAAIPYLFHFILPFVYIAYIFLSENRKKGYQIILKYIWLQGLLCMIGALIQLFFPTSPPWFNDSAVFDPKTGALLSYGSSEAAFSRIDNCIGLPIFHLIYSQSKVQFGAFPSLHCAWPALILFYRPWFSYKIALLHLIWIVSAAMYTGHHYFVDALGGIFLSGFVVFINSESIIMKKISHVFMKLCGCSCVSSQGDAESGLELYTTKYGNK